MPTPTCTQCRRAIPGDDINVAQDVAYCRDCNRSHRLSDLTLGNEPDSNLDLQHPPKGAWFTKDGNGTVIGATNRNLVNGVGFLFFALFWNSIVSVFVFCDSVAGLRHFHVPLPAWIPKVEMEGGGEMSSSMIFFSGVFMIPFILIGLFLAGMVISSFFGRTEVIVRNTQGTIFTGIASLGWKRRFNVVEVKEVRTHRKHNSEGSDTVTILIETREGKQFKLGSLLTNERRQFVLGALRKTLLR